MIRLIIAVEEFLGQISVKLKETRGNRHRGITISQKAIGDGVSRTHLLKG